MKRTVNFICLALIAFIMGCQSLHAQQLYPPVAGTTIYKRVSFDDCNSAFRYDSVVVTIDSVIIDSIYWQLVNYDRDSEDLLVRNKFLSPLKDTGAVYKLNTDGTVAGLFFCLSPQCSGTIGVPGDPLIFREDTSITVSCIDGTASSRWMISGQVMYQFDSDFSVLSGVELAGREAIIQVRSITDVEDVLGSNLAIYPNPVTDRLTIRLDRDIIDDNVEVTLTSMLGQKAVLTGYVHGDKMDLNVRHLPPGTYTCSVILEGDILTEKVVKL